MSGKICLNQISRSACMDAAVWDAMSDKTSRGGTGEGASSCRGASRGRMLHACTWFFSACARGMARKRHPRALATTPPVASSSSKSADMDRLPLRRAFPRIRRMEPDAQRSIRPVLTGRKANGSSSSCPAWNTASEWKQASSIAGGSTYSDSAFTGRKIASKLLPAARMSFTTRKAGP